MPANARCELLDWCCQYAAGGGWREATAVIETIPAWRDISPLPARSISLAGRAVLDAPYPFLNELARIVSWHADATAENSFILDSLFGHAVAGLELSIDRRNAPAIADYGAAAIGLPQGTSLREAVLQTDLTLAFAAMTSHSHHPELAPWLGDAPPAGSGESSVPEAPLFSHAAIHRLLNAIAEAGQYDTLCDAILRDLLLGRPDDILTVIGDTAALLPHLTALWQNESFRLQLAPSVRRWLETTVTKAPSSG